MWILFSSLNWAPTNQVPLIPMIKWIEQQGQEKSWYDRNVTDVFYPLPDLDRNSPAIHLFFYGNEMVRQKVSIVRRLGARKAPASLVRAGDADAMAAWKLEKRENLEAAVLEQRENFQALLNIMENIYGDMGSSNVPRASRLYRFKYEAAMAELITAEIGGEDSTVTPQHSLLLHTFITRAFHEHVFYFAEAFIAGFHPQEVESETKTLLLPLANKLMIAFARFCVQAESVAYAGIFSHYASREFREQPECKEKLELLYARMKSFEQAYTAFEEALYFTVLPCQKAVSSAASSLFYEEFQWLGLSLVNAVNVGIREKYYQVDDIEAMDPTVLISLPLLAILLGCRQEYGAIFMSNCTRLFNQNFEADGLRGKPLAYWLKAANELPQAAISSLIQRIVVDECEEIKGDHDEATLQLLQDLYLVLGQLASFWQNGKAFAGSYLELVATVFRMMSEDSAIKCASSNTPQPTMRMSKKRSHSISELFSSIRRVFTPLQ